MNRKKQREDDDIMNLQFFSPFFPLIISKSDYYFRHVCLSTSAPIVGIFMKFGF